MTLLIVGLVVFFGSHSVIIFAPGFRDVIISRIGLFGNRAVMSVISLVGLGLIIWGYALSRHDPDILYYPASWAPHVTQTLMLLSFILLGAFVFPGRISLLAGNPVLLATFLWAIAHLLSNGTLADLLLFGSFLVWSLADLWSLRSRSDTNARSHADLRVRNDIYAVTLGLLLYVAVIFWLHELLIGVRPV